MLFCSNLSAMLGAIVKNIGKNCSRNIMPYGEDRSRNRCERVLGKVGCRKARRKPGVLHTHFNGNGTTLRGIQFQRSCCKVTGEVPQYIMADYYTNYLKTVLHDSGRVHGNHRCNNENNRGCGN